jgi:dTDP-4-amino-4,6-dideoxygalactose transaminase
MAKLALFGGSKVLPNGLGVKWPIFDKSDEAALLKTFRSGSWWRGGDIKSQAASVCGKFEREFAAWHDAPFGLCVPNGTIAVELALRAVGVKAGDEVIVPAFSFVVSASAPLVLGAVPVFADCDPLTYQPDADAIEALISPRTAAIVIVHFGGYPADLDRICKLAKKHNLPLIEDCAHSQGSQWRGKGVGSYGNCGTFSFQQSKAITSGEGGIVLCRDKETWSRAYRFHNLGRLEDSGFYDFYETASNYRLTDLQGAILLSQLAKYKKQIVRKQAAQKVLSKLMREIGGVEPLPDDKRITRRGNYFYTFRYNAEAFGGLSRETFIKAAAAEGVGVNRCYGTPIYKYPLFQNMKWPAVYKNAQYKKTCCPETERIYANESCALGHTALLADKATIHKIAEAIAKVKANAPALVAMEKKEKKQK